MFYNNLKHIGGEYMSVVLAICGENYVKMISDGRVVLFADNNPSVVVNENFNKLKRINQHVVLGFAGDKTVCEKILKKLRSAIAKLPKDTTKLFETAKLLQQIAQTTKLGFLKVHFIVGGITNDGKMGLYVLNSSTGFELESCFPQYGQHQVKVSFPFGKQELCDMLIDRYFISTFPETSLELDKKMIEFVNAISDIDNTVNKNYYTIEILT